MHVRECHTLCAVTYRGELKITRNICIAVDYNVLSPIARLYLSFSNINGQRFRPIETAGTIPLRSATCRFPVRLVTRSSERAFGSFLPARKLSSVCERENQSTRRFVGWTFNSVPRASFIDVTPIDRTPLIKRSRPRTLLWN